MKPLVLISRRERRERSKSGFFDEVSFFFLKECLIHDKTQ